MKDLHLIKLYCTVCHHYNTTVAAKIQRLSNNFCPKFTDEECITIYIFGIAEQKLEVKAIYRFIKEYWSDWFPHLPSYQNFNRRINYLAPAFQTLCGLLMSEKVINENVKSHLLDSMPIVVANQNRSNTARAASGLCNKGYCSAKEMYYYGVKLHTLGQKRLNTLPKMCMMRVEPASENDITIAKQLLSDVRNMDVFADKMFADKSWAEELGKRNVRIFTLVKLKKGQAALNSADVLFSYAVSRARQVIESFYSWIQQKTRIHIASKVRSDDGLIAFIFARLAFLELFYS